MIAEPKLACIILLLFVAYSLTSHTAFAQNSLENWQTFVDPASRFSLFYPSELQAQGKENFLSSIDLTLGNSSYPREFKITLKYNDDDTSLLQYSKNLVISPENYLMALENQLKPSYQIYNLVGNASETDELYGYPTISNIVDFTNHLGESGRMMNLLAIVNGKGSFIFSYSNTVEAFYQYLPTVNEIIKSIVILK